MSRLSACGAQALACKSLRLLSLNFLAGRERDRVPCNLPFYHLRGTAATGINSGAISLRATYSHTLFHKISGEIGRSLFVPVQGLPSPFSYADVTAAEAGYDLLDYKTAICNLTVTFERYTSPFLFLYECLFTLPPSTCFKVLSHLIDRKLLHRAKAQLCSDGQFEEQR